MSHPVWVRGLKRLWTCKSLKSYVSHPVWVRGLKHVHTRKDNPDKRVAPRVGAWIETSWGLERDNYNASHPVWVRGLKHLLKNTNMAGEAQSHPVWVRGLKLVLPVGHFRNRSRTPCGCVD